MGAAANSIEQLRGVGGASGMGKVSAELRGLGGLVKGGLVKAVGIVHVNSCGGGGTSQASS